MRVRVGVGAGSLCDCDVLLLFFFTTVLISWAWAVWICLTSLMWDCVLAGLEGRTALDKRGWLSVVCRQGRVSSSRSFFLYDV